jgi:hypothetical protein
MLLSLVLVVQTQAATTWNIQTVDSTGEVGLYSSLALDSNGNPHISYYNSRYGDLKYAKWTGSTFSPGSELIDFLRENLLYIAVGIIVVSAIALAFWRRRK